jgi:uncharacterized protein YkwD
MRHLRRSILMTALAGGCLVLGAALSRPGPTGGAVAFAADQPGPAYAAPSGPAGVLSTPTPVPTRTRVSPTPFDDGGGRPAATPEDWDLRPPRRAPSLAGSIIHQVEAGDTVYGLAGQYGVSPAAILHANDLDEESARSLDIGQELVIPRGPDQAGEERPTPVPTVVRQVQPGDALSLIAQEYGITVESIVAANDLADAELIRAGQDLILPAPARTPPADPMSGTEPLTQPDALTATLPLTPAEPVAATASLSPSLAITRTDTAGLAPDMSATEPISAAGSLAETPAISETVPSEPTPDLAEIEEALAPEAATDADPAADLVALESAMLQAVNTERAKYGLPAYQVDDTLAAVARAHAQDMVERDYVGHSSPEGERVRERLRDVGLNLARAGENYYVTTRPAEEAVAYTLAWFMGDPPHRHNILHAYYTRIGIGVAYESPGWYIFVLDFAGD